MKQVLHALSLALPLLLLSHRTSARSLSSCTFHADRSLVLWLCRNVMLCSPLSAQQYSLAYILPFSLLSLAVRHSAPPMWSTCYTANVEKKCENNARYESAHERCNKARGRQLLSIIKHVTHNMSHQRRINIRAIRLLTYATIPYWIE